ncbi:DUF2501 domain-containing protein [Paraburkholderia sp. A2WS-5]|uniref:DUF2501 domain-containing protein n=1 Tax=unclassified Paraburkholderia TaxID=2615204 RepID=UPI003B75D5BA
MHTSALRSARALIAVAGVAAALLAPWNAAQAQLGNLLNQVGSSGSTSAAGAAGSLGNLGSALSGSSLTSGGLGNVTGLIQYCVQNNFLNADTASSVQNSLLGKLPGGASSTDPGYKQGANGILQTGNGQQLDLSSAGLQEAAKKKVCDTLLTQARSML